MIHFNYENLGSNRILVYELQPQDELDNTALEMLAHNRIPNLLPVSFTQFEHRRYLRYSGLSTNTLKHLLTGTLTRERLLTILEGICDGILSCEEYLLDGNAFVMDPEYIFIDMVSGKVKLVYFPLLNHSQACDYDSFFREVIAHSILETSDNLVGQVLYYLNATQNFSLLTFSRYIKKLRTQKPEEAIYVSSAGQASQVQAVGSTGNSKMPGASHIPVQSSHVTVKGGPQDSVAAGGAATASRKGPQTGAASAGAAAKKPLTPPKEGTPQGFDVPGKGKVASSSVTRSLGKGTTAPEGEPAKETEEMSLMFLLRNYSGENLEEYRRQKKEKKKGAEDKGRDTKGKKSKSLVLSSTDEKKPYRFVISKREYTIGRSEKNDGVLSDIHPVSREHVKIIREKNEYYLMDLNSKFGTKLNGTPCSPARKYGPLREDSIIQLPELTLRIDFE